MRYTLKVARKKGREQLHSAFIEKPLAVNYRLGKVTEGQHENLPLFALKASELSTYHTDLSPGCGYSHVMVVGYEPKDVRKSTPWASSWDRVSVERAAKQSSQGAPDSHVIALAKCQVMVVVPREKFEKFKSAKAFLTHYKKLLKA